MNKSAFSLALTLAASPALAAEPDFVSAFVGAGYFQDNMFPSYAAGAVGVAAELSDGALTYGISAFADIQSGVRVGLSLSANYAFSPDTAVAANVTVSPFGGVYGSLTAMQGFDGGFVYGSASIDGMSAAFTHAGLGYAFSPDDKVAVEIYFGPGMSVSNAGVSYAHDFGDLRLIGSYMIEPFGPYVTYGIGAGYELANGAEIYAMGYETNQLFVSRSFRAGVNYPVNDNIDLNFEVGQAQYFIQQLQSVTMTLVYTKGQSDTINGKLTEFYRDIYFGSLPLLVF